MTDLQSTLDAIDAATGCQQCESPLGDSPSSDFCGELCQAAYHAGVKGPPAPTTLEWRHSYHGEVVEPLCDLHVAEVRAALKMLGIGHAGCPTDPPASCYRCVDKREPRDWIDRFVPRRSR